MLKRSFGAIKPLSDQRHAPDPELTRIIEKMMKVDLKARYQLMSDVYKDLVAFQTQQQGQTSVTAGVRRHRRGKVGRVRLRFALYLQGGRARPGRRTQEGAGT